MNDFLTSDNLFGFITGAYIIAGLCFIGALAGLSKHETAKNGNILGMVGMALALVATVLLMASRQPERMPEWIAALVCAMLITTIILLAGGWLLRMLGEAALSAIEKLMGLILTAVAVEMVLAGIHQYFIDR